MSDQYGNTVDAEVWVPCYRRHEPMPGVHQDVPHANTQCITPTKEGGGMKLIINTTDGGNLTVEDFDPPSLMAMIETWDHHPILTIALDTGIAYIPKTAVTRIDSIDEPA